MTKAHARRFIVAVFGSLLLHALVFSGSWIRVPVENPPAPPLQAQLLMTKPQPPAHSVPRPNRAQATRKRRQPRRSAPVVPPVPKVMSESPLVLPPEPEFPAPAALPDDGATASSDSAQPARVPQESAEAPKAEPVQSLPTKGRITYTIFLGTDKFSVGKTEQSWEIHGDSYKLGSVSETTGLASLFAARHMTYLSEGTVTPQGLRPNVFLMSRVRRGQLEAARVTFDWSAGRITFGKIPEQHEKPLPRGSQDIVSFMYQLSLSPPAPGRIQLPITNGVGFDMYQFDVSGEEQIDTPLGALQAVHVQQVRKPGEESIEIWLAPAYRFLPVRLLFRDREGKPSGEQIVSEIRLSHD